MVALNKDMRADVFDGKLLWIHHGARSVAETSIKELAGNIRRCMPNCSGVMVKCADGPQFQGTFDTKGSPMAINSVDDIERWCTELHMNGLELHLWAVPTEIEPGASGKFYAACCELTSHPGVKSMVLDVESGRGFWNGVEPKGVHALCSEFKANSDVHLGICADMRPNKPEAINLKEFLQYADSLHPMVYWHHFGSGRLGPDAKYTGVQAIIDDAIDWRQGYCEDGSAESPPIVPMLQTYPTPLRNGGSTPVPPDQAARALAIARDTQGCATLFVYGRANSSIDLMSHLAEVGNMGVYHAPDTQPAIITPVELSRSVLAGQLADEHARHQDVTNEIMKRAHVLT